MNKKMIFVSLFIFFSVQIIFPQKNDNWKTKFETSNYLETSRYDESIEYFSKLAEYSDYAKLFSIGISPQGRNIYAFLVTKENNFEPENIYNSSKPLIFIINGIHSGEIEGKEASKLLLREILISKEKEFFLDYVNLLVIPVFSVDGHERFGKYNRINQNGPVEMGWRTTAQNLNLNRDWMKADSPEMQSLLKLIQNYKPDFFIDNHTTNGADYQYTVTYGMEVFPEFISPSLAGWSKNEFLPYIKNYVEDEGFLFAPYMGFKDGKFENGLTYWSSLPRFSNGYTSLLNRPGLLVETHMLKPFKERVFATKSMIEGVLNYCVENGNKLKKLIREAEDFTINNYVLNKKPFALTFKGTDDYEPFLFKGISSVVDSSEISGGKRVTYTGEPIDIETKFFNKLTVTDSIIAPYAYVIPREWNILIERMKLHGIEFIINEKEFEVDAERYKFKNIRFNNNPYEGRHLINAEYESYIEKVTIPEGSFIIKTNQPNVRAVLHFLEPKSPDSFLRWGFFNTIFEQKEYFEPYVMEKIAKEMLEENPELKKEFEQKLAEDEKFRDNWWQRLNFFYERSPFYDKNLNLYPVMRINNKY